MLQSCCESMRNFTGSKLVYAGGLVVSAYGYGSGDLWFNSPQGQPCFLSQLLRSANFSRLKHSKGRNFKGAVGSADLKISKSALLSLNHHNFSNTKPICTE